MNTNMTKPIAIICIGPGCSGKSTFARKLVAEKQFVEVNRDSIRFPDGVIDWSKWESTPANEQEVTDDWNRRLDNAICLGKNIVISDTNLNVNRREEYLSRKLTLAGYEVELKYFVENLLTLLTRNAERDKDALPEEVIVSQQRRLLRELMDEADDVLASIRN